MVLKGILAMHSFFALKPRSAAAGCASPVAKPIAFGTGSTTIDGPAGVRSAGVQTAKSGNLAQRSSPLPTLLAATDLVKSYRKGRHLVPVLVGVDLQIREQEFVAIEGQSGSGKSTLLHLLGTLDAPDDGEIYFAGQRIDNLPIRDRDRMRNRAFGMIFQFYHLLPELTALENVVMPLMIADGIVNYWRKKRQHIARAEQLLDLVGLSHRLTHKPHELSGGEMQRAAIARALIAQPRVLLADEPTGNLDRKNGEEILKILRTLNQLEGVTIVMVTHDHGLARQADRIVRLVEGRVQHS